MPRYIRDFSEISASDGALVGGKNASLGELTQALAPKGLRVPEGFAVTCDGYRHFLASAGLDAEIDGILARRKQGDDADLSVRSFELRNLISEAPFPDDLRLEIEQAYARLVEAGGSDAVAVRSSATAEDLPNASFAGQLESFLNVRGADEVVDAVRKAFASVFGARAISYREDMGFPHQEVALSAGVQRMVRSDQASAGVAFSLDPDTGHRGVLLVTSNWGLGESVVQGIVSPDQFYVHRATLADGYPSIVWRRLGSKQDCVVYARTGGTRTKGVPKEDRDRPSLSDADVLEIARGAVAIEEHYSKLRGVYTPMDIEWAKDGPEGSIYFVQARPETVHARGRSLMRVYRLEERGETIVRGLAVGSSIASGPACVLHSPSEMAKTKPGCVLVTDSTDPDWEPVMKKAAAIVTERGGRTSHAAIVARELGVPAIVGATGAMSAVEQGEAVTVSCAEGSTGLLYRGELPVLVDEVDLTSLTRPRTRVMMNVADPERALSLSMLPCDGVGLARMEFIFASWVRVHPLALTRFDSLPANVKRQVEEVTGKDGDKTEYFVDRLAQGIGMLAAAFHPRPVILRFSDFKTNEYARLIGGEDFEPKEDNPMLGWRGASRYYHPDYKEGFLLEVAAVRRVREKLGLTNLMVMVPFCRTPAEGRRVLSTMAEGGLVRGRNGLKVFLMAELPSNIVLAHEFARDFDGFSIGSNDLTQLTLGIDRDSATLAPLFDETDEAVKRSCAQLIESAHRSGVTVGICGQAPSDHPSFAAFLVEQGIDSISLTPDTLLATTKRIAEAEESIAGGESVAREEDEEERTLH